MLNAEPRITPIESGAIKNARISNICEVRFIADLQHTIDY
jgi:hypothetical protein